MATNYPITKAVLVGSSSLLVLSAASKLLDIATTFACTKRDIFEHVSLKGRVNNLNKSNWPIGYHSRILFQGFIRAMSKMGEIAQAFSVVNENPYNARPEQRALTFQENPVQQCKIKAVEPSVNGCWGQLSIYGDRRLADA